jgi:sterile alpha motif and leucine zipper-containing kinase AZK
MGACTIPGKFAIVMELLDGNLEELLFSEEGSKMRLFQRVAMAKEAALGMNRLHKTEPAIIHRDFKLENLMVPNTIHAFLKSKHNNPLISHKSYSFIILYLF